MPSILRNFCCVLSFLFVVLSASSLAVETVAVEPPLQTPLDLPLLDLPFNVAGQGYSFPGMQQSLALSKDYYQSVHYALMQTAGKKKTWVGGLAIAGFDYLSTFFPLGNAWLHEEWHRAILSRRNISSYNDVYNFPIFQDAIAVSHLSDADLIQLKKNHPAEQVRLQSAGWEAEYELSQRLERDSFFSNEPGFHLPLLLMNYLGTSGYLFLCASDRADSATDDQNRNDGTNIPKRDFTGLDCTGWVYDLFRPDEPYEARGPHPSGVGINRYRKHSDLTREEQNYLSLQAELSLLNLLNPQLLNFRSFGMQSPFSGHPARWNASLRHMPTSFGSTTDLNLYWKELETQLLLITHQYFNKHQYFPGIELEWIHYPIPWLHANDWLTTRLFFWLQPKGQRFDALAAKPGGLISFQYGYALSRRWNLYAQVEGKTEGWVAGNPYLDSQLSLRVGAIAYLF